MPELRKDPVTGRWVIIATERHARPSDFKVEKEEVEQGKVCPFCPGNESLTPPEIFSIRDGKVPSGSAGWVVRVVSNKYPALKIEGELGKAGVGMYDMMNGIGAHEVIIESPEHTKRIEEHSVESLARVFEAYKSRTMDLMNDKRFHYILVFKNEGKSAGASLMHPHSQLIALPITPKRAKEELIGSKEYFQYKDRCVFCDIMREELAQGLRLVYENKGFIAFCPFASRFPFEVCVVPRHHHPDYFEISPGEVQLLADCMIVTMGKLSRALKEPEYNYILHSAPMRWPRMGYWVTLDYDYHWHFEIMPRLTKIAGFEWGSGFYINPTPPEDAARFLREV